jgi:hypothetical protein
MIMYKRIFLHALIASILAAIAALIYNRIYFFATEVDYSKMINIYSIFGYSIMVGMVISFVYFFMVKWLGKRGELVFNFLYSMGSFACIMIPLSVSLPLDVKFPELFPGLAVPMVFFPALAWFTIRPLFSHTT